MTSRFWYNGQYLNNPREDASCGQWGGSAEELDSESIDAFFPPLLRILTRVNLGLFILRPALRTITVGWHQIQLIR